MLNILALETSTDACSIALAQGGQITSRCQSAPRQHAKCLQPMLEDLLSSCNLNLKKLDVIAYGIGPGSFTGLRIAASAAQGLAFILKIPVYGGCTLECQAIYALEKKNGLKFLKTAIIKEIIYL